MLSRLRRTHRTWGLVIGTVLVLSACSGSPGSGPSPSSTASTVAPSTSSATSTPAPTASATPTVDVRAAEAAALALFTRSPLNLNDPSAGYVWSSFVPDPDLPFSAQVRERLAWLTRHDYFDDRHCGENYMVGNQDGLFRAPKAVAATPGSGGAVTVVLRQYMGSEHRDLTVVMAQVHGTWLAVDLRRGTGPNASIFSSHPNC